MIKITTTIVAILTSMFVNAQNLDTVSVSLTLPAQSWAWAVGKYGYGTDSVERVKIRAMRDAIRTANPANWTTNVTINNIPGRIIVWIYSQYQRTGFGEIIAMGSTNAERMVIYNNIRALSNSAIQYYIGVIDANSSNEFTNARQQGKSILIDN